MPGRLQTLFCQGLLLSERQFTDAEAWSPAETSGSSVPRAAVWQLDFCSRPVLDERGKKKWELIICDETRSFEFARFFSNNQINSTQVHSWRSPLPADSMRRAGYRAAGQAASVIAGRKGRPSVCRSSAADCVYARSVNRL